MGSAVDVDLGVVARGMGRLTEPLGWCPSRLDPMVRVNVLVAMAEWNALVGQNLMETEGAKEVSVFAEIRGVRLMCAE